ncbi:hypothetical protein Mapa_010313 [Marchantia paleacea]|nr:hypothetical protein Mapa_010313 [Marchantia paleacea]
MAGCMMWSTSIVFLVLLMGIHSSAAPIGPKLPLSLTFFLHDNLVANSSETTVLQVATASGIRTPVLGNFTFGNTNVFSTPIRKTIERNSTLLGIAGGIFTSLSQENQFFYQFTASYNSADFVGTISGQGMSTPREPSWEVSIVGGTGDFRGARGYVVVNTYPVADFADVIFRYQVHLLAH